jgi:hypothetical protein
MTKLPRRRKNGKPPPQPELQTPPEPEPEPRKPYPADELDALLEGPDEGGFLRGLDGRVVVYPTLVKEVAEASMRVVQGLSEHDLYFLWPSYEGRETELAYVRERAAYGLGWEHGAADGRAEFLRSQAPDVGQHIQRLGDKVRALVVNGAISPLEAALLLAETMWAILTMRPAPPFDG